MRILYVLEHAAHKLSLLRSLEKLGLAMVDLN